MGVAPITIPQSLAYVLNTAGEKSGVDFNYLVQTAQRESAMNPNAKAPSSSAVGLFQFLESSWLAVMKSEGPRLGYQKYADAIIVDKDGDYVIKDKALRAEVLKLREDPQVAADMAAAFTRANGAYLEGKFGRMPSPGELYIAHFLGPQGAEKMFNAGLSNPDQTAAKLFPKQAKANPQIFYSPNGHARTVREVYKALVAQHNGIIAEPVPDAPNVPDAKFAAQQMSTDASAAKWPTDAVPSRLSKADMSFTSMFATQKATGAVEPLIGMEAAQPLIDAAQATPLVDTGSQSPMGLMPKAESPPSLAAIDAAVAVPAAATPSIGDPFAAPAPLIAPDGAPMAFATTTEGDPTGAPVELMLPSSNPLQQDAPAATPAVEDSGIPRARVLISKGVVPNSAFFTQLWAGSAR